MQRTITLLVAITMLTMGLTAVPTLAGQHEDQDTGPPDERPQEQMNQEDRKAWAQEKRDQALDRAQQAGLFGHLTYEDGAIDGAFIQANLDEDEGTLTDHATVREDTHVVLDSLEVDADVDGDATVRPTSLVLPYHDGELRINDNPTALAQYRSTASTTVTITLADGYDATVNENATKAKITGDVNGTILLTGDGDLSKDGDTLTASIDDAGSVLFHLRPDEPGQQVSQSALEHAASEDRLGGEIRVSGAAGEAVDQDTPVDVNMSAQYVNNGQAIIETDADLDDEERILHLVINRDNLPVDHPQEVEPKIDRETIPQVDSIDDAINATGDAAVAYVAVHETVVEVTIYMPDFSLHSVNIQDATQDISDIPDPLDSPNPTGLGISLAQQASGEALAQADAWSQMSADAQAQATIQGQEAGLFGQATYELGTLQGAHVQASVDADTGVIENYRLVDRPEAAALFEQIRPADFTQAEPAQELGTGLAVLGDEVALIAHDTPNGQLEVKAGDAATTVEMDVNADADIDRIDDRLIKITTPNGVEVYVALVAGDGDLIVEGDTILANLGANAALQALADPASDVPGDANLEERIRAATAGNLGAEASITAVDGTPVEDRVETSVTLETQDVGQASVTVTASSEVPDPRAVTLNLDPELVDGASADEVSVLIDGQAIQAAQNAADVLEENQANAMFYAEDAGDGLHVLVNIDGFSEHDVTVQSSDQDTVDDEDDTTDEGEEDTGAEEDPNDTPTLGALALLGVLGVTAVVRKR